jgi:hypothetical protein
MFASSAPVRAPGAGLFINVQAQMTNNVNQFALCTWPINHATNFITVANLIIIIKKYAFHFVL